ncbi:hypothetical protein ACYCSE_22575 [Paenibacillus sp. SEL1]
MQAISALIFRVSIEDIFECSEAFKIQVDEDPNITKWILMLSVGDRNGVNPNDSEPPAGGRDLGWHSERGRTKDLGRLDEQLALCFHSSFRRMAWSHVNPPRDTSLGRIRREFA